MTWPTCAFREISTSWSVRWSRMDKMKWWRRSRLFLYFRGLRAMLAVWKPKRKHKTIWIRCRRGVSTRPNLKLKKSDHSYSSVKLQSNCHPLQFTKLLSLKEFLQIRKERSKASIKDRRCYTISSQNSQFKSISHSKRIFNLWWEPPAWCLIKRSRKNIYLDKVWGSLL